MTPEQGEWFTHISGRYATPERHYHDARHLRTVLSLLQHWCCLRGYTAIPSPLFYAALFHDAVYDARHGDNEEQSAVLCREELTSAREAPRIVERAVALILSTKSHQPVDNRFDTLALLDADLWILGSAPLDYADYVTGIRLEYQHVPDAAFRTGRAAVLERFLARPRLYFGSGSRFRQREHQARQNIASELHELRL